MICMSVVEDGPRIAFAAYHEERNVILLNESYANGFETAGVIESILTEWRPTLLLISNKIVSNENLLDVLTTAPTAMPVDTVTTSDTTGSNTVNGVTIVVQDWRTGEHTNGGDHVGAFPHGSHGTLSQSTGTIPHRLLKSASFELQSCRERIQKLHVRSLSKRAPGNRVRNQTSDELRQFPLAATAGGSNNPLWMPIATHHALATIIDFESNIQVQALGSLLAFLETTALRINENHDGYIMVEDIINTRVSSLMNISAEALSALNIFSTEHHPLAVAKGYGQAKEGCSLFSLLDRTKSRPGRLRLKEWMLKPLQDVQLIASRQDGVELFMHPEMREAYATIVQHLRDLGALDQILNRMQKCCTKPNDFLVLLKSLKAAVSILGTLELDVHAKIQQLVGLESSLAQEDQLVVGVEANESLYVANRYHDYVQDVLQHCHSVTIQNLLHQIVNVIDEEATVENGTAVVRQGYSPELDEWRLRYRTLGHTLHETGESIGERLPHLRKSLTVLFIPQVGFLVALGHNQSWVQAELPEDFAFVFTEDDASYFKNIEMRNLDQSIGDLDSYIKDQEGLIVTNLEDDILDHDHELRETINALADLDCVLAFASCSADNKYVRPSVVPAEERCIHIRRGRHPLQEIIIDGDFVPNDVTLDDSNQVNIVTGPNFSGKSCYARQVGILTYMAHIGCFIPCDEARISVVDKILVRFSMAETCAVPQSSFQVDLTQMGSILRRAGPYSLVIVDEFGKGTSPGSGIGLLTASLRSLSNKGSLVICTTHFLEVFSSRLVRDGEDGVRAMRMTVQIPVSYDEQAIPLFKLETGVSSSSAGLACAKMAGVKEAVIIRAQEILAAIANRSRVQPLPEIIRDQLSLTTATKHIILRFLSMDWKTVCDESIQEFLSEVSHQ